MIKSAKKILLCNFIIIGIMKNNLNLELKQAQKLTMTPELLQSIKVLQMNVFELDAFIEKEALSNPMIDIDESVSDRILEIGLKKTNNVFPENSINWIEYVKNKKQEDDYRNWDQVVYEDDGDRLSELDRFSAKRKTESLYEHLSFQLHTEKVSTSLHGICEYIIESLDKNGYMTLSEEQIVKDMGRKPKEIRKAWQIVRNFDPAGVAALNLKDCLMMQIRKSDLSNNLKTDALELLKNGMEEIARNALPKIARKLNLELERVQEIKDELLKLNPKPGANFVAEESANLVIPEIRIAQQGNNFHVEFTKEYDARIKISSYYKTILDEAEKNSEVHKYLNERMEKAKWVVH